MLDVALKDVAVNQFDTSKAARVFVEPKLPGYERVNLADMARAGPKDNRTTVRRTLPPPASRNGIKLGQPTPVIDEPEKAPHARVSNPRRQAAPGGISSPLEDLVNAPLPVGAESNASRWAAADASSPVGR